MCLLKLMVSTSWARKFYFLDLVTYRLGLILPIIPPRNPSTLLCRHTPVTPFRDIYVHKHPAWLRDVLPSWTWKWAKWSTIWAIWNPIGQYDQKVEFFFYEWAHKFYSYAWSDARSVDSSRCASDSCPIYFCEVMGTGLVPPSQRWRTACLLIDTIYYIIYSGVTDCERQNFLGLNPFLLLSDLCLLQV